MKFSAGVIWGEEIRHLFQYAKEEKFAIPAINVTSTSVINAVLACAKSVNSPVIIQVSHGGSRFLAGKNLESDNHTIEILGSVSAALHVHNVAKAYGIPVILHTDHANKENLLWVKGVFEKSKEYYFQHHAPLFGMHMIDLSEESLDYNILESSAFLREASRINVFVETEIGITGGEEDAQDNSDTDSARLYSNPEDIFKAYNQLGQISQNLLIAAAFGNLHGVFKASKENLKPEVLKNIQTLVKDRLNLSHENPINLACHGASGSDPLKIREAIDYGVVKVNIDTDMQWAYWKGVLEFYKENEAYLQSEIGNLESTDESNKKYFDPRSWLSNAEKTLIKDLKIKFEQLNCINRNI